MIKVHHLDHSRSHRVLWLLEELSVPYELVTYRRQKNLQAPPELRKIHPLGKSPVVELDGVILAESGAILDALAEQHGRLVPARGTPAYTRYRYFLHYAEGSLMPYLLLALVVKKLGPLGIPARGYVNAQLKRHLDFLEAEVGDAWLCGPELTAADIQLSYPLEAAVSRAGLSSSRPKLLAYLERMRARPAYRRALEKGGPVALEA
jgi:glutathione S-transferase